MEQNHFWELNTRVVQKVPALYRKRMFIIAFRKYRHRSRSWARPNQSMNLSNAILLLYRFKLQFHLRSSFESWFFPWWSPFKSRVLSSSFPYVSNSTIEEFCCFSEYSTLTKCFRKDRMPGNLNTRIICFFNPLDLELDIYSLVHHLCKMWMLYEPRRVALGNTRHFMEE